jgi:hypothetical protein
MSVSTPLASVAVAWKALSNLPSAAHKELLIIMTAIMPHRILFMTNLDREASTSFTVSLLRRV